MLISHLLSRIWKHPISGARFWATADLDQLLVKGFVKKGFNHGISMALFGASSSAQIFSQQDQQIHSCGCLSPSIWLNIEHGNSSQSPTAVYSSSVSPHFSLQPQKTLEIRKSWGNTPNYEVVWWWLHWCGRPHKVPVRYQPATHRLHLLCGLPPLLGPFAKRDTNSVDQSLPIENMQFHAIFCHGFCGKFGYMKGLGNIVDWWKGTMTPWFWACVVYWAAKVARKAPVPHHPHASLVAFTGDAALADTMERSLSSSDVAPWLQQVGVVVAWNGFPEEHTYIYIWIYGFMDICPSTLSMGLS